MPSGAFAQTAPNAPRAAATQPSEVQAERLLAEGTILFDRGDFEGARRLFQKAYDLHANVRVLLNLGLAELNAEHFVDAAEHLRYFASRMDAPQAQIDAVQNQLLPKAYARVVRVVVDLPSRTKVLLDSAPDIVVSGVENALITTPGDHELKLPDGRSVTFRADAGQIVRVAMPEPAASAARAPAPAGASGSGSAAFAPGATTVPARADRPVAQRPATLNAQGAAPGAAAANSAPSVWTARTITLAAGTVLTIAAAASGAVFYAKRSSDQNEIDSHRAQLAGYGQSACGAGSPFGATCAELSASADSKAQHENLMVASFAAAGVFGAATVAGLLFWPRRNERTSSVGFAPIVDSRTLGAAITGAY